MGLFESLLKSRGPKYTKVESTLIHQYTVAMEVTLFTLISIGQGFTRFFVANLVILAEIQSKKMAGGASGQETEGRPQRP